MKNLTRVKDLIKNKAKAKKINPQILLRIYMMERVLERIALSKYKNKFILKGGMLIGALVGLSLRTTIDIDATIKAFPVTKANILTIFEHLLSINIDDGIEMKLLNIKEIREEDKYAGFRLSLLAVMESARIPIKFDISVGDKITPKEIKYSFKLILEDRSIDILAYNIETVLAEKFETIISRGSSNTRLRDFYDIYILLKTQKEKINPKLLKKAIKSTMDYRGTTPLLTKKDIILDEIFSDKALHESWILYQKKYKYPMNVSWEEIKDSVLSLKNY